MKEKNDFKGKRGPTNELARPVRCPQCHNEEIEPVEVYGFNSYMFIKLVLKQTFLRRIFPKAHRVYGYRCMNCGYLMFFTERYLD